MRFRLDDLVVDSERLTVERDGSPLHVEPQVFDVMCYLAEHRDRVVPKEELLDQIWGDRFVSTSALSSRIMSVRKLVGDDGERQAIVKTVHGRGFRWVADIELVGATAPADTAPDAEQTAGEVPPTSTRLRPARPPALHTETVGRDRTVHDVIAALDRRRMVTLVGAPGVGKTRIALEVLRRRDAADGGHVVCFVELHTATTRGDLVRLVRRALGVDGGTAAQTEPSDHGLERTLLDELARTRMLLVLDNCEHVATEVAGFASAALAAAPELTVLATSRLTLWVEGGQLLVVRPLDRPGEDPTWADLRESPAGRLFLERSAAAGATWAGTDEEAMTIHEVCRRLDGIPLAIELAAARARWMPVERLLGDITASTGRTERFDPLASSLASSRTLLDDAARQAFDALSVFAGSFHLDAATEVISAVCPAADPLAVLQQLVDHSLVDVADARAGRYRLLAPVRQFAASGDPRVETAGPALLAHYAEIVERTWPSRSTVPPRPWSALDADIGDIFNLLERAADIDAVAGRRLVGALGLYWWMGQAIQRCVTTCEALGEPDDDDPAAAARYLLTWSSCSSILWQPMPDRARRAYELALETEQWRVAASALSLVVASDHTWADLDEVESAWDEIESLYRRADDVAGEAWARVRVLGHAQACAGRPEEATASFRTAFDLFGRIDDDIGLATAAVRLAREAVWIGTDPAFDEALSLLPDDLVSTDSASTLPHDLRAETAWILGRIAEARGETHVAVAEHRRAVAISEAHAPDSIASNSWRVHLAGALRRSGRYDDAARCLREAGSIALRSEASTRVDHSAWVVENIAGLLAELTRDDEAATLFGAAEAARERLDRPMRVWDRPTYDHDVSLIGRSPDVTAAWSAGRRLDPDAALGLAISACDGIRFGDVPDRTGTGDDRSRSRGSGSRTGGPRPTEGEHRVRQHERSP